MKGTLPSYIWECDFEGDTNDVVHIWVATHLYDAKEAAKKADKFVSENKDYRRDYEHGGRITKIEYQGQVDVF